MTTTKPGNAGKTPHIFIQRLARSVIRRHVLALLAQRSANTGMQGGAV